MVLIKKLNGGFRILTNSREGRGISPKYRGYIWNLLIFILLILKFNNAIIRFNLIEYEKAKEKEKINKMIFFFYLFTFD